MSRAAKLLMVAVVLTVALVMGMAGCGKKGQKMRAPEAQSYVCENPPCGYKFGVPRGIPLKEEIWPPIVCPKCKQHTAVRAHVFAPKAGGLPQIAYYTKYTDAQIKMMEEYRDKTPEDELEFMRPEMILDQQQDTALRRNEGSTEWFSPLKEPQKAMSIQEFNQRYRSLMEVFPDDWPVVPKDEVKQR